jgi:uncharacterized protein DUF4347
MASAGVWTYSKNSPAKTCPDARLLGDGTPISPYPGGHQHGQAGWDYGLMFNSLGDLSEKLRLLKADKGITISRLAIDVHGAPGAIDAASNGSMYDFNKLWSHYSSPLVLINLMLEPSAAILIMGCQVAKGEIGADFISQLSKTVFPGHKVVGFTTIGETLRQYRKGGYCSEPGMRDTPYDTPSAGIPELKIEREKEALTLPWASESSPHAKIALEGAIIHGAEPAPTISYAPEDYMPGTWNVGIGPWSGFFVFSRGYKVYWIERHGGVRHPGKWWTVAGSVDWSFDDDAPDFKRTFEILTPLHTVMKGTIGIGSRASGFFEMAKVV